MIGLMITGLVELNVGSATAEEETLVAVPERIEDESTARLSNCPGFQYGEAHSSFAWI